MIYIAYAIGTTVKNAAVIYESVSFSTLNIERELTAQCVMMHGIREPLLRKIITNKNPIAAA